MELKDYTTEQLKAELKRRVEEEKAINKAYDWFHSTFCNS